MDKKALEVFNELFSKMDKKDQNKVLEEIYIREINKKQIHHRQDKEGVIAYQCDENDVIFNFFYDMPDINKVRAQISGGMLWIEFSYQDLLKAVRYAHQCVTRQKLNLPIKNDLYARKIYED